MLEQHRAKVILEILSPVHPYTDQIDDNEVWEKFVELGDELDQLCLDEINDYFLSQLGLLSTRVRDL